VGIVLGVLGILGKVLLLVIVILCVLVLLLLFYPIKYQVAGELEGAVRVRGRVHWFWFLVRIYFSYEEDFHWKIRILGLNLMKIMDRDRSSRGRKDRKKSGGDEKGKLDRREVQEDAEGEREQQEARIELEEKDVRRDARLDTEEESGGKEARTGAEAESDRKEARTGAEAESSWWERNPLRKWWHKIRHFMAGIKRLFKNLRRKAGFAWEMVSLLREDNSRDLVCILKDNVVHLWRKLKPKVFRLHLLFGTGDPASTGEILGLLAILYAWYGDGLHIVPDFERKVWEGDFFVKGRLSLFTLVLVFVRVFLSDEWKCFKREYDKLMTGNCG